MEPELAARHEQRTRPALSLENDAYNIIFCPANSRNGNKWIRNKAGRTRKIVASEKELELPQVEPEIDRCVLGKLEAWTDPPNEPYSENL